LAYNDEPYIKEGTTAFFITLQIISHLAPGGFFGFAYSGCANLILYCVEKIIKKIIQPFRTQYRKAG